MSGRWLTILGAAVMFGSSTLYASPFCSTAAWVLANWNHAVHVAAKWDGQNETIATLLRKYAPMLEGFGIEDLSEIRDAGRLHFADYFQGSPDLFAFRLFMGGLDPQFQTLMHYGIDREISQKIREIAFDDPGITANNPDLVETGKINSWLPPTLGGYIKPPKDLEYDFPLVTTTIRLSDKKTLYFGARKPPDQPKSPELGGIYVENRGSRPGMKLFTGISVIDHADISPSQDRIVTVGLVHSKPEETIIVQFPETGDSIVARSTERSETGTISVHNTKSLETTRDLTLITDTEALHVAFVSDTILVGVFEDHVMTYTIHNKKLIPTLKNDHPDHWVATSAAHSRDRKFLFIGFQNGHRMVVNNESGMTTHLPANEERPSGLRHSGAIKQIGIGEDGTAYFLSQDDGVITRWHP